MRTRIPHWKRALAVLLSLSLVLASVPVQAGKITRYVHTDHLGSVSAKTDSTGVVMMRRSFTPYGENEQAETDGPGYTGHYSDTGSGLVYMQQRYYDPEIGRFLSVDPVTFGADKPQQFNRYWYANGNPFLYADPDGRESGTAFRSVNNATNGAPVEPPPRSPDDWAGPAIGASLAVASAPAVVFGGAEVALVALTNPAAANSIGIGVVETVAGEAIGGASLVAGSAAALRTTTRRMNPKNLIPTQTRGEMSGSQVKRLSNEMKQNGYDVSQPIIGQKNGVGRVEIVDGHHRAAAAVKAGVNEVPVQVTEKIE